MEEQQKCRRYEVLWFGVNHAIYLRHIALQTAEASRNLLDDSLVNAPFKTWGPDAQASLEDTEKKNLEEAMEWDAKIDEGFLMLNEFERANGLPLSFRMEEV